ncbi:MAG: barstar family protein [Moraxellaceae bacterium]|nr:barstar family protein [Moraxellaceae bacterium]
MNKDLDYEILRRGGVTKCCNLEKMEQYLSWFQQANFTIYKFNAYKWYIDKDYYRDFQHIFGLPNYGNNWDAFHDVFTCDFAKDKNILGSVEHSKVRTFTQ